MQCKSLLQMVIQPDMVQHLETKCCTRACSLDCTDHHKGNMREGRCSSQPVLSDSPPFASFMLSWDVSTMIQCEARDKLLSYLMVRLIIVMATTVIVVVINTTITVITGVFCE